jgi:hypothetical protein
MTNYKRLINAPFLKISFCVLTIFGSYDHFSPLPLPYIAMSNALSPFIANLYMGHLEVETEKAFPERVDEICR